MFFYLDSSTGKRYYVRRAFSFGGINYTNAGATEALFTSLGFTKVFIATRPDDRFYVVSGPDDTGAYTATDRDLGELKAQFIVESKRQAKQILDQTDWVIVRSFETAMTANPRTASTTIRDYRAAVRTACDTQETEINAVTTVADLETLITSGLTAFPTPLTESETY